LWQLSIHIDQFIKSYIKEISNLFQSV
jgi:hypothetical protein